MADKVEPVYIIKIEGPGIGKGVFITDALGDLVEYVRTNSLTLSEGDTITITRQGPAESKMVIEDASSTG